MHTAPYKRLHTTLPRTVFKADFQDNGERENAYGQISTRHFLRHHLRCACPPCFGNNRLKIVPGGAVSCVQYGIFVAAAADFVCTFAQSSPAAEGLVSRFGVRGGQGVRRYFTTRVFDPAELRGAFSGCSRWRWRKTSPSGRVPSCHRRVGTMETPIFLLFSCFSLFCPKLSCCTVRSSKLCTCGSHSSTAAAPQTLPCGTATDGAYMRKVEGSQ